MEADRIFLLECLTEVVACLETQHSGILRVDSHMRSSACMGRFSFVADIFRYTSVHSEQCLKVKVGISVLVDAGSLCHAVNHHGHVDAV